MLDNIADLLLTVGLLCGIFGFPVKFALRYMVPGTAIGVLVGDLIFFWMALRLAKRTGRDDVTAMPLGLDTPSTFGMVFFVLGPAFLAARATLPEEEAAKYAWHIGICAIFISGLFKIGCAFVSGWIRRGVPRAGLLGSLAAIALVLISFLPLLEVLQFPIVGLVSLAIILTTLVARVPFPGRLPGALSALLVSGGIFYLLKFAGFDELLGDVHRSDLPDPSLALFPTEWTTVFQFEWWARMPDAVQYLPVVIPFALATVVGGIDCTESAAAAGDEYHTPSIIGVEAVATLVASLCGGVIQTTPYIGHPAYKMMGGRAAYVLATALFVGAAGLLGYFGYFYAIIPKATVFPILIFIGLEITAQSYQATPRRHYPAVVLACIPALASLALIYIDKIFGDLAAIQYVDAAGEQLNVTQASLSESLRGELQTIRLLANGFIVTSLIWASALAAMIDRRLRVAAFYFLVAAICAALGIIHSPLPGGPVFLPWNLSHEMFLPVLRYTAGYLLVAAMLFAWQSRLDRMLGFQPILDAPAADDGH